MLWYGVTFAYRTALNVTAIVPDVQSGGLRTNLTVTLLDCEARERGLGRGHFAA
jgi:hypothetical protein